MMAGLGLKPELSTSLDPFHNRSASHQRSAKVVQPGMIGWGMHNPALNKSPKRVVLAHQPHKRFFDADKLNSFIRVNGNFSKARDQQTDSSVALYEAYDLKSLREMIREKIRQKPTILKNLYLVDKSHETHVKELDVSTSLYHSDYLTCED